MSAQPFMQLYVADYLADTLDLSTVEHGAYLLLLMTMWRHDARLPNDPAKLARIARMSPAKFKPVWAEISRFFEVDGDTITNPRLLKEHQKASKKSEVRATAGSAGGKAKALKDNNAPLANASDLPQHSSDIRYHKEGSGGGSACASETDPTWREQMLQAMGVGSDGIVGPSRFIGSVADMATAAQWEDSLKLDRPTIIAVLTETIAGKRDGPPKSFRYFTPAMQRTAAELQAPPLQPTEIEGPRHERPIASDRRQAAADDRHRRIILAAATARSPSGPAF